ncbi:MAG: hypothetical protein HY319_06305 [Armatimonadetes bacterium]|nr:hypothetical protein [Armatimonadota bacterium]
MNQDVFEQLVEGSHRRMLRLKRLGRFFHTFAGAVIEAMRERGYRLVGFDSFGDGYSLQFESDQAEELSLVVDPYRTDLPYLIKAGHHAQIRVELATYVSDPDQMRAAQTMQMRTLVGSFFGGGHQQPSGGLREPGAFSFRQDGARVLTSVNLLWDLSVYRKSDLDLDKDGIGQDIDALVHGLRKFREGLLERYVAQLGSVL